MYIFINSRNHGQTKVAIFILIPNDFLAIFKSCKSFESHFAAFSVIPESPKWNAQTYNKYLYI